MFLHYSDLPSHTALLYLSENALKSFVPARSAFLYRLLSLPSFVEIYGDVYDPISVVFLTAAIVFRLHLFSNDRAVHPTLQIMLHYYLFFFQYIPSRWTFAFVIKINAPFFISFSVYNTFSPSKSMSSMFRFTNSPTLIPVEYSNQLLLNHVFLLQLSRSFSIPSSVITLLTTVFVFILCIHFHWAFQNIIFLF